MDFRHFEKAVSRAAQTVAPAYHAGSVALVSVVAPPFAPFLAMVPPNTALASNMAIGGPFLLFLPEYRKSVQQEQGEIDYAKIGELAALAYLKGR